MIQPAGKPFLTLENINVRLRDKIVVQDGSWQLKDNEQWAIMGPNGSGKTTLVRSLWGGAPLRSGSIHYDYAGAHSFTDPSSCRGTIGYVSFETHQSLMEYEAGEEEFRAYAGQGEVGTTVREVIFSGILGQRPLTSADEEKLPEIAALLEIEDLLSRGVATLSSGELRKTLIARALMKSPRLLILDEPFDGLDEKSRISLEASINHLMTSLVRVILVVHRIEEIIHGITHVLFLKEGRIFLQGSKEEVLTSARISELYGCPLIVEKNHFHYFIISPPPSSKEEKAWKLPGPEIQEIPEVLIEMEDTTVQYGDQVVLDHVNWTMKRGENWAILGSNGSGKSTIVKLILGDQLQGYANSISLFGKPKGSGETLWEIKKYIGVISPEFQLQYRKRIRADEVIASGFFDSIGLYHYPTAEQKEVVRDWVALMHIGHIARKPFDQLSYGQKRLILLARAMVKRPLLLVMDEPCHGLDIPNRRRILEIIEKIGTTHTHLLYITHQSEEVLDCITHILKLEQGKVVCQGKRQGLPSERSLAVSAHEPCSF